MSTPTVKDYDAKVCNDKIATILSGQTTSDEIDLNGTTLCGFHLPAAITGTTLKITAASAAGGTFNTVQSAGADYSLTIAASKYVPIENLAIVTGLRFIKIVSGSAEGADRLVGIATRSV